MSDLDDNKIYSPSQIGYSLSYQQRIEELKREVRAWRWLAMSIVTPKGNLRKARVKAFLQEVQFRLEKEAE